MWKFVLKFFLQILFIYLREHKQGRLAGKGRGRGRWRGRERSRPSAQECGSWTQDPEIMTWAIGSCLTDWATQVPPISGIFSPFTYCFYLLFWILFVSNYYFFCSFFGLTKVVFLSFFFLLDFTYIYLYFGGWKGRERKGGRNRKSFSLII